MHQVVKRIIHVVNSSAPVVNTFYVAKTTWLDVSKTHQHCTDGMHDVLSCCWGVAYYTNYTLLYIIWRIVENDVSIIEKHYSHLDIELIVFISSFSWLCCSLILDKREVTAEALPEDYFIQHGSFETYYKSGVLCVV